MHHGSNSEYLDRNHGGIITIFDHLFGTYQKEDDSIKIKYGLVKPITSKNPFIIAFREWYLLFRDIKRVRKFSDGIKYLYSYPGWHPDKSEHYPNDDNPNQSTDKSA